VLLLEEEEEEVVVVVEKCILHTLTQTHHMEQFSGEITSQQLNTSFANICHHNHGIYIHKYVTQSEICDSHSGDYE
jgi:hypothetical protein